VNQAALVPGNRALSLAANLNRYVQVPSSASLDVTGPFTIEAWVKTVDPSLPQQGIAERYNWLSTDDGGFALRLIAGRPQFWVIRNANAAAMVESPLPLTGGWHHVAGVFTGSELKIYVDGRLDGTTVSSLAPAAGTLSLKIGARGDVPVAPFDGYLDEVRLSAGALYSTNFAPAPHLTATAGPTRGLWKFDDLAATDSSGNGNHGSFQNGATAGGVDEYPEYGSVALDGLGSYVQIPDGPTLDITGKITLEAWIKTTATSANQRIAVRGNYSLKLISASGGNKLKLSLTGAASSNHISSNGLVSAGVWHHVAGVYANGEMRLYIDGVLDNSGAASEGPASASGVLRIGAALDGSELFQGWIDEVRIASKNLYSTTTILREPRLSAVNGTRGLWRFDRHFVSDTSGNGNHGAFFLGAWMSDEVPAP
jgi:Concanavalin A-like lectin/glucanases superfamily